jgi:hypothetical protein
MGLKLEHEINLKRGKSSAKPILLPAANPCIVPLITFTSAAVILDLFFYTGGLGVADLSEIDALDRIRPEISDSFDCNPLSTLLRWR